MTAGGVLTIAFVALVAYANGANDVSKGVATLIGSGVATLRRGLVWGTFWTGAGAAAAFWVSAGLARTFSTALVSANVAGSARFPLTIAVASAAWILLASRNGFPVSTTHSLTGAIVGTGMVAEGFGGIRWPLLFGDVVLPLVLSPLLAAASAYLVYRSQGLFAGTWRSCARFWSRDSVTVSDARLSLLTAVGLTDMLHWTSSATLSFARGLNDAPKMAGLAVLAVTAPGASRPLFLATALAMAAGSYVFGRRVTETLACGITEINRGEGVSANATAATFVLLASFMTLPVSTTHVSTGAIVGAGWRDGASAIRWKTVSEILAAWIITLPISALLAAAIWLVAGSGLNGR